MSEAHGRPAAPEPLAIRLIGGAFWLIGAGALAVLTGVTVVAVAWRYLLSDPIFGIEDVASIALGVFVAAALVTTARKGGHIALDLLTDRLGTRARGAVLALAALVGIGACALAAWALADKGGCGRTCGDFTSNLSIPHPPFYYLFAAAFAAYGVILAWQTWIAPRR